MKTRFSSVITTSAIATMVIGFFAVQSRADTVALSFTQGSSFSATADLTLGWSFSVSSSILVTQLGMWDGPTNNPPGGAPGDGLGQSHIVTIWTSAGVQKAQATLPSGTGSETDNFRYITLGSPVFLAPGIYTIGAFFAVGSPDPFILGEPGTNIVTTALGVTYLGSRSTNGNGFPPGDALGFSNSYFGPNFQFNDAISNPTPDTGSSLGLLLLGLIALVGSRRSPSLSSA